MVIVCYQNWIATVILLPFLISKDWYLRPADFAWLAILGIFCTALAHVLFVRSLVHVKAQLASIIACLEPLYGIIFALVLFGEVPALRTILGGGIILGTIILVTIKRNSSRVTTR